MNHAQFFEQIPEYLEGALDPVQWHEFMAHRGQCRSCDDEVNANGGFQREGGYPQECLNDATLRRWNEGDLPAEPRDIAKTHLSECRHCREKAHTLQAG